MKLLNKETIAKEKNQAGIYQIRNCKGKIVYVGSSKITKHRLQSYYQKDDFSVNKTKESLRPKACKYSVKYMPIQKARDLEKRTKGKYKDNYN